MMVANAAHSEWVQPMPSVSKFTTTQSSPWDDGDDLVSSSASLTVLHALDEALCGQVVFLNTPLGIGRVNVPGVDLVVQDKELSKLHATFRACGDEGYEIVDHGSKNGTYVNGLRAVCQPLQHGDLVRAGNLLLLFAEDSSALKALGSASTITSASSRLVVMGPQGSGRRHFARAIHQRSTTDEPLLEISLNEEGQPLATAHHIDKGSWTLDGSWAQWLGAYPQGSLLLHELQTWPTRVQTACVKALKKVSSLPERVFVTCDGPLGADVHERLREIFAEAHTITCSALSERRREILELVHGFLQRAPQASYVMSVPLMEALVLYPWPGQVTELQGVVEHLCGSNTGALKRGMLPAHVRDAVRASLVAPEQTDEQRLDPAGEALFVRSGGHLRTPGGDWIDLSSRVPLWTLIWELVMRRKNTPGEPASVHDLNACYDNNATESALRRTYKNLSLLRGQGLRELIVLEKGAGYVIPADIPLVIVKDDA